MKKYILSLATLAIVSSSFVITSCKKDDGGTVAPPVVVDEYTINKDITQDTTLKSGQVYTLYKRIKVKNGATLTIEPGTIIKGVEGEGANSSVLIITRGSKIMAEGTPDKPIIFTSIKDKIKQGEITSPNLGADKGGYWGGLVLLGKAKISVKNGDETNIEGIPVTDSDALYGGNDDTDNSGVLKYVSIRHGGTKIAQNNEINGLTLGGVGNGTIIENIEVVANSDDGVEWFGGSVNVKNLLVWNNGDDAIDTDQAWNGTLDNFVVLHPTGNALELDGGEGELNRRGTIKNGYVNISGSGGKIIDTDNNTMIDLDNIFFTNFNSTEQQITSDNEEAKYSEIVLNVEADKLNDYFEGDTMPEGVSAGKHSAKAIDFDTFSWTWAYKAGQVK